MKLKVDTILLHLEQQGLHPAYIGDNGLEVEYFSALSDLAPRTVTWIKRMETFDLESIDQDLELLFISDSKYKGDKKYNVISCDDPKSGFFSLLSEFFSEKREVQIESTSTILSHSIGEDVSIGHNCFIDKDVTIGRGTTIKHNVVIEGKVCIGDYCIIESGTIIGDSGFGYYKTSDGVPTKVPDFGGVIIGNRVEIGANTAIVRGTLADTVICDDVKIDNLCHIAHNAYIGERCMVVAMTEISWSVHAEADVYFAPCSSVDSQIHIGANSLVGIGAVVTKDVEANKVVAGVPARVLRDNQ